MASTVGEGPGGVPLKPAAHFPTSQESMSTLKSTVQALQERLATDSRRSQAFGGLAESMQLRINKITQLAKSRPTTRASDYADQEATGSRPVTPQVLPLSEPPVLTTASQLDELATAVSQEARQISCPTPQTSRQESLQGTTSIDVRQTSASSENHDVFGEQMSQEYSDLLDAGIPMKSSWKLATQQSSQVALKRKDAHQRWSCLLIETKEMNERDPRGGILINIPSLEDAFYCIAASYDLDGDGTLSDDEVLHVFSRCQLFDEVFTINTARNFFKSWSIGCNTIVGVNFGQEAIDDGIGYEEFECLLKWTAEMKGIPFARCTARVIRLSRKVCDEKCSQNKRLETMFNTFCKLDASRINVDEFLHLCVSLGLIQQGKIATGDVYSVFLQTPGVNENGADFKGFMHAMAKVGELMGLSEPEAFEVFAAGVGAVVKTDEETVRRVKMKIKQAASLRGESRRQFFLDCDEDNSGCMDFDEFLGMCRQKLQLTEREHHLKLLFEKMDDDDSGELSIDELIDFIES